MFEPEGVDEREKRDEKRFLDAERIRLVTTAGEGVPTLVSPFREGVFARAQVGEREGALTEPFTPARSEASKAFCEQQRAYCIPRQRERDRASAKREGDGETKKPDKPRRRAKEA